VIAVDADCADYDDELNEMRLFGFEGDSEKETIPLGQVARVLDGQHRIAGLFAYSQERPFDVNVTVFVGLDLPDQANIFATVNLEQTRVNRSIAFDLLELAKVRSPQKTCHNVAITLDKEDGSPFFHMIKRLGVATPGRGGAETLAQATFVDGLLSLITGDPKEDRTQLLKGRSLPRVIGSDAKKRPLRNLFVREDDYVITEIVWNWFEAVSLKWRGAWQSRERGMVINRTNGYWALIRLLRVALDILGLPERRIETQEFGDLLNRITTVDDREFSSEKYRTGGTGRVALFALLREQMQGE
jgi:DGQHR domain-containing protein